MSISLDSPNPKQAMTKVKDKTRTTRNDKEDVQEQIILDPAAENQNPKSSNQNQKKSKSKSQTSPDVKMNNDKSKSSKARQQKTRQIVSAAAAKNSSNRLG